VIELYPLRQAPERELAEILGDEPGKTPKLNRLLAEDSGRQFAMGLDNLGQG